MANRDYVHNKKSHDKKYECLFSFFNCSFVIHDN